MLTGKVKQLSTLTEHGDRGRNLNREEQQYLILRPIAGLHPRQRALLVAAHEYRQERGYPPCYRELAKRVGLKSINTVGYHREALVRRGLVSVVGPTRSGADSSHRTFAINYRRVAFVCTAGLLEPYERIGAGPCS